LADRGDNLFGDLNDLNRELDRLRPRIRDSISNAELLDQRVGRGNEPSFQRRLSEEPQLTRRIEERQRATKRLTIAEEELAAAERNAGRLRRSVGPQAFDEYTGRLRREIGTLTGQAGAARPAAGGAAPPGGGGGVPPAAPPPPPGGGRGGGPDDPRYQQRLQGSARATQLLSRETEYLVQQEALASNALRRYGALTTEFINEAARGRVTIRELGTQARDTIGKFGGWVGAGAAVYAAVGGLYAVGSGAIAADKGVSQMQRTVNDLDKDMAKVEFRKLSEEFNVPIEDVSAAATEMGKVFHNQDDALLATKAVLYSVRTGNLDVATSSRYLISIIQGFRLPATEMATRFDQINEAQNQFGADIEGTEAGVARAAGTFRAAGGDFNHLLALITTGARVTGQSGTVIGTAVQRIPGQLRQQANKEFLKSLGIDASAPITQVIEESFKVAEHLSGEKLQQLGSAIAGKQYGPRVFTPLLQQYDLYKKVLKDTSPESSKNSAQRELNAILSATEEQLKSIITELEILGSNLEQAGFFDSLKLGVGVLKEFLVLTNNILEAFNNLPAPVRDTLTYFIQLRALLGLMRRFQFGEYVAGGPTGTPGPTRSAVASFFQPQGGRASAGFLRSGLSRQYEFLEEERMRSASSAARASFGADLGESRARSLEAQAVQRTREGATDAEVTNLRKQAQVSSQAAIVMRERAQLASLDEEATRQQIAANTEVQRSIKGKFGRTNVAAANRYLAESGAITPLTYERPTTVPPGVPLGRAEQQVRDAETGVRKFSGRFRNLTGRMATVGSSLGGAASSLLGRLGTIAFGAFAFFTALDLLNEQAEAIGNRIEGITVGVSSQKEAAEKVKKLRYEATAGDDFSEEIGDILTGNPFGIQGDKLGEVRRDTARIIIARYELIKKEQDEARAENKPIPFRFASDISREVSQAASNTKTRAQLRRQLGKLDEELEHSMESLGQGKGSAAEQRARIEKVKQQIQDAYLSAAPTPDLFHSLLRVSDPAELLKLIDQRLAAVSTGPKTQNLERAAATYSAARVSLGLAGSMKKVQEARDNYFSGVEDAINEELEQNLAITHSPTRRAGFYSKARQQYRQAFLGQVQKEIREEKGKVDALKDQIAGRQNAVEIIEKYVRGATGKFLGDFSDLKIGGVGVGSYIKQYAGKTVTEKARSAIADLQSKVGGSQGVLGQLTKERAENLKKLREVLQKLDEQQYEEIASLRNAQADFRSSRTADPASQARTEIETVNSLLQRAIEVYGRNSEQVLQLLTQRQQAMGDLTQAQYSRLESGINLTIAQNYGPNDDLGKARAEIARDQQLLAFMRAHSNRFDPTQILDLQAQIIDAEQQLAEDVRNRAFEMKEALIDITAAQAGVRGNDVGVAKAELRKAELAFKKAQTPLEKRQARADLIQKRGAVRDAAAQKRIEDIEFQGDIGKLTLQGEIEAYTRLLNTAKLSRDTRRALRTKLYQLKHEAESESGQFDLAVGDIKLPTVYEIKRAIAGGLGGAPIASYSQTNVNININGGDTRAVGREVLRVVGGRNKSARRSAGLVG
jgi:TP901 family phage tail tape measure protein